MKFYGMQKMTLLDYPGYVACTLFTGGCNFRCPFCHNALLVLDLDENYTIPEEEVLAFLKKGRGYWTACASPAASRLSIRI